MDLERLHQWLIGSRVQKFPVKPLKEESLCAYWQEDQLYIRYCETADFTTHRTLFDQVIQFNHGTVISFNNESINELLSELQVKLQVGGCYNLKITENNQFEVVSSVMK
ncbi:hypothetical protein [Piscirickettsia litoralis]|uniref:Uncharacterized protein n=1 Tax=Piscirickettsia litoralis TaxID=1891921 RepID=A0ABX3A2Z2_9GAMM|nr:hypothetical protein [Piscirickettsia litoralis]ODN41993.1 hypothetical protein BGC07_02250 [Piscirickettsia litoralis]